MSGLEAVPQSNAESEADGEEESTRKNAGRLVRMQADSVMGKPKPKPKARPTLTRSRNPWIHWPGEEQVKSRQVETDHNNKAENLK